MSFLNALASDGLSVGLRFYTAKLNSRTMESVSPGEAAEVSGLTRGVAAPLEPAKTAPVAAPKPAPTPEELAAGRAEAKARLTGDGSLGQLQAAGVPAASPEGQAGGPSGEAGSPDGEGGAAATPSSAGGVPKALTPEEEKEVARLKAEEARIQSEAKASGAEGIQYSYTTGPDNGRYVSGARGWVTEGGGSAQSESGRFGPGQDGPAPAGPAETGAAPTEAKSSGSVSSEKDLSEEERQAVREMKRRDQEVRIHEQAHVAAASGLAGAPVYEYQTGPDGKRYAVGGHVEVQTSGSSDPETALREAEAVKRAATAPADPSGADRAAAASASAEINRLKAEQASDRSAGQDGQADDGSQGWARQSADGRAGDGAKVANGSSFNQQVLGAYAAVKFGTAAQAPRPVLARA